MKQKTFYRITYIQEKSSCDLLDNKIGEDKLFIIVEERDKSYFFGQLLQWWDVIAEYKKDGLYIGLEKLCSEKFYSLEALKGRLKQLNISKENESFHFLNCTP